MKPTKQEFESMMQEFIETQDAYSKDEMYCTERDNAECVVASMVEFFYKEDITKENRYKEYLKLKEEFGA